LPKSDELRLTKGHQRRVVLRCPALASQAVAQGLQKIARGASKGWEPDSPRREHAKAHKSEGMMSESKVTIEQKDNGKWACFLHLTASEAPVDLGKEFKTEEKAEMWADTSEAVTAIDMMTRKFKK
jgi:hypothetical protein